MNFTREPLVETIITPKEGYKLVIRNSKGGGQEEFFVDVVEVISFGNCYFFRSLEKPKHFLVPVSDYEVLEVREARMVLKTQNLDKGIKIGGGRDASREISTRDMSKGAPAREIREEVVSAESEESSSPIEEKVEKRREKRKYRKRKERSEEGSEEADHSVSSENRSHDNEVIKPRLVLIPPPPKLISETMMHRAPEVIAHKVEASVKSEEEALGPSLEESSSVEEKPKKEQIHSEDTSSIYPDAFLDPEDTFPL